MNYSFNDNVSAYARAGTSFRLGGFNAGLFVADVETGAFATEEVFSYEFGVKSELLDRRLRLNAAYYKAEYDDLQVAVITDEGNILNENANVDFKGIEIELTWLATEGLEIFGNIGTIDHEVIGRPTTVLPRTPDYQGQIGFDYSLDFSGGGSMRLGSDYRYSDTYKTGGAEQTTLDAYGIWNAQISYMFPNNNWSITAAGFNLTDEVYSLHSFIIIPGLIETLSPNQPRRWLVTARYEF